VSIQPLVKAAASQGRLASRLYPPQHAAAFTKSRTVTVSFLAGGRLSVVV
jgi:hypothetical protein